MAKQCASCIEPILPYLGRSRATAVARTCTIEWSTTSVSSSCSPWTRWRRRRTPSPTSWRWPLRQRRLPIDAAWPCWTCGSPRTCTWSATYSTSKTSRSTKCSTCSRSRPTSATRPTTWSSTCRSSTSSTKRTRTSRPWAGPSTHILIDAGVPCGTRVWMSRTTLTCTRIFYCLLIPYSNQSLMIFALGVVFKIQSTSDFSHASNFSCGRWVSVILYIFYSISSRCFIRFCFATKANRVSFQPTPAINHRQSQLSIDYVCEGRPIPVDFQPADPVSKYKQQKQKHHDNTNHIWLVCA